MRRWIWLLLVAALGGCVEEGLPATSQPEENLDIRGRFDVDASAHGNPTDVWPLPGVFAIRETQAGTCRTCTPTPLPPAHLEWVVAVEGIGVVAHARGTDVVRLPIEHASRYTATASVTVGTATAQFSDSILIQLPFRALADVPPGSMGQVDVLSLPSTIPGQQLRIEAFTWQLGEADNGVFTLQGPQGWEVWFHEASDTPAWEGTLGEPGDYILTWRPDLPLASGQTVVVHALLGMPLMPA